MNNHREKAMLRLQVRAFRKVFFYTGRGGPDEVFKVEKSVLELDSLSEDLCKFDKDFCWWPLGEDNSAY